MKHIFEELIHFIIDEVGHGLFESAKRNTQNVVASICAALLFAFLYSGFVDWDRWNELGVLIFLGPACSIMLTLALFWAGRWLLFKSFSRRKKRKVRLHLLLPRVARQLLDEYRGFPSAMLVFFASLALPWYGLLGIQRGDIWFALYAAAITLIYLMMFLFVLMLVVSDKCIPLWMRFLIVCLTFFGAIGYELWA